jgi:hypothetical protein
MLIKNCNYIIIFFNKIYLNIKILKIKHILTLGIICLWWYYINPNNFIGYIKLLLIIPILIAFIALSFFVLKWIFTYFENQKNKN